MLRHRMGPLLLVSLGTALLVGTVGWYTLVAPLSEPAPLPVPQRLAEFALTRHAFGQEATQEIARLHGQGFPLTGGAVAYYGDGTATLWVARTWGSWAAARMVEAMTNAIAKGDSPFSPTGKRRLEGRTVYTLSGLGQTHFYFQAGDRMIWLAASPDRAEVALRDLLAFWR